MANIIKISPPDTSDTTDLSSDVAVGATLIKVSNESGFSQGDYIVIDSFGSDKAEIAKITGVVSGKQITTSKLINEHDEGSPVAKVDYNKIRVYRSGSFSGSFSVIATIDIRADEPFTYFSDDNGVSSSWYKATFYNADNSKETSLSFSLPIRAEIELIAVPCGQDSNSFLTLKQAEEEVDKILDNEKWRDADVRDKARALMEATARISTFNFKGSKVSYWQALPFPDSGSRLGFGKVTGGNAGEITSSDFKDRDVDDFWKGGGIKFVSGNLKNKGFVINGFSASSGTFYIEGSGIVPDVGSEFMVYEAVPEQIRRATAGLALWLIEQRGGDNNPNVKSKSIGDFSVTYFERSEKGTIPDNIYGLLSKFIKRIGV